MLPTIFDDFFGFPTFRKPFDSFNFNNDDFHMFKENENDWELVIPLPKFVNDENINIEIEDDKTITVKYEYKDKSSSSCGSYTNSLPENIIVDTLTANFDATTNQLIIKVDKKPVEKEKETGTKRIKINVK